MVKHISQESNRLFKREILILELIFEKIPQHGIIFYNFSHYRENPLKSTNFDQIAINVPFVRMLVKRAEQLLNQGFFKSKRGRGTGPDRQIHRQT